MSIKIKLTKIQSNHNNVRTDVIEGVCVFPPEVNESFQMIGESLDPNKDVRMIKTTPVISIETLSNTVTRFTTRNSTYEVEILEKMH